MMNNKIRIISLLLLFSLIPGLWGCSLAVENAWRQQTKDRLIGGLVTREHIGGEKTYATYEWISEDKEDRRGIEFGEIDGQFFYFVETEDENGEISHRFYECGFDVDRDEETSSVVIKLSNKSYFMPGKDTDENMLYLNPVYETPEGEFYVVSGNCASMGEGMNQTGASCSLTLSEEDKITFGDNSVLERVEISAEFIVTYEPIKMWISQMDEKDKLIKKEEFHPEEIPLDYPVEAQTEYILVETELMLPDGTTAVQREISEWDGTWTKYSVNDAEFERKQSEFWTFYPDGKGFLTKKLIHFIWP